MNETERPRYQVRRNEVLQRVPDSVERTATGLAEYFGLSRSVAWRLFLGPDGHLAGGQSVARICATFPDVAFEDIAVAVESEVVAS